MLSRHFHQGGVYGVLRVKSIHKRLAISDRC